VRALQLHDYHGPWWGWVHGGGVVWVVGRVFPFLLCPAGRDHQCPADSLTSPSCLAAGALSLMYLPLPITNAVRVMLVAHNVDYNGTWHIGTAVSAPA
jgi:hypothetical protein